MEFRLIARKCELKWSSRILMRVVFVTQNVQGRLFELVMVTMLVLSENRVTGKLTSGLRLDHKHL